ncbi:coiled-coil domain-containing protein [Tuwongella immobilis]|uniref:Uncharacterized protein n=1 Tax=Tuwongella immobilis TaxID=692036 RepID=A0A6C2YMB0_9BACT|nr:hypothetical protein [Tuwongella immobilis]VIP02263.1 unnamed protein product [Tuwongella immobilis]VTS00876.1 unnamed protein product [Tuwongella immobilis]
MRCLVVALLMAGLLPGTVAAQSKPLDPGLATPYRLRVVLHAPAHPIITAAFRQRLAHELESLLGTELGRMGELEWIDLATIPPAQWQPLWKQFVQTGFATLEGVHPPAGEKTHFVELSYLDGQYQLAARQLDGSTGLASPLVRRFRTPDRAIVPRLMATLIRRDFGIISTIERISDDKPELVRLTIRGGNLAPNLDRLVKPGEVFTVVQMRLPPRNRFAAPTATTSATATPAPPAMTGVRMPEVFVIVQDAPVDGVCRGKLVWRYESNPMPKGSSIAGYLGMKLGTVEAPLRLRLVNPNGTGIDPGIIRVKVNETTFQDSGSGRDETLLNGNIFVSKRPFPHVVFTRILVGKDVRAQMLIPLLEDEPLQIPFRLDPNAEQVIRQQRQQDAFLSRITDNRNVQIRCFQDLIQLERNGKNALALSRAEATYSLLAGEVKLLTDELEKLKPNLPNAESWFQLCQAQIDTISQKQEELSKHIGELKTVIARENDPAIQAEIKALEAKIREAELLVRQGEIEKAIDIYDDLLAKKDDAKIRARRDALKQTTAVVDAAHGKARDFLLQEWPKLENAAAVKAAMPEFKSAVAECKRVKDQTTLIRAELSMSPIVDKLNEEVQPLLDAADEDSKTQLEAIRSTLKELSEAWQELSQWLRDQGESRSGAASPAKE